MNKVGRYLFNILISIDQFINTLLLGDPDETISSRLGKWRDLPHTSWKWKIGYSICRLLHWFDKDHCLKTIEPDEGKHDILREKKHGE